MINQVFYNSLQGREKALYLNGIIYGYPHCCIAFFLDKINNRVEYNHFNPFFGTGFIPCPECAKQPKSKIIEKCTEKRMVKTNFPDHHNPGLIEELSQIIKTGHFTLDQEITLLDFWTK